MEWKYMNTTGHSTDTSSHNVWHNATFLIQSTSVDIYSNNTTTPIVAGPGMTDDPFGHAMKQINIYATPVIVFVGIVTNFLSFCVFVMTHLRMQSSSVYLATLAVSDSGFLIALFFSWFSWLKIHLVHRPVWCHIIIYLTYTCSFVSVYSVVGFTCERFIAVLYPLQRKRLCTRKNALIVEAVITLFALLVYSIYLWTTTIIHNPYGLKGSFCGPLHRFRLLIDVMTNLDTVMTLIVPSAVIITLNIRIGYTVYNVVQWRNTLRESQRPKTTRTVAGDSAPGGATDSSSGQSSHKNRASNNQKSPDGSICIIHPNNNNCDRQHSASSTRRRMATTSQLRTTRMLLLVSSVFVLLNLPSHAFRVHGFMLNLLNKENQISITMTRWQELCQIIYYLNFATNFFLYSFSARSFREALKRLIKRVQNKCHKMVTWLHTGICCNTQATVHEHVTFGRIRLRYKKAADGIELSNGPRTI